MHTQNINTENIKYVQYRYHECNLSFSAYWAHPVTSTQASTSFPSWLSSQGGGDPNY